MTANDDHADQSGQRRTRSKKTYMRRVRHSSHLDNGGRPECNGICGPVSSKAKKGYHVQLWVLERLNEGRLLFILTGFSICSHVRLDDVSLLGV